ncbi:MAG: hypothetical protein JW717_14285 [Marinilabiliaceae bacterium]|nr:hypothetical protein [Marinilabiliaceae bacterium]
MKNLLKFSFLFVTCMLVFAACSDDDDALSIEMKGVLVLNEGSGTGSISYIKTETDSILNNAFKQVNSVDLGSYPQAMALSDKYIFITVTTNTGAGLVEVVDRSNLKHVTYFDGFSYPREITVNGNYAYVSNGKYKGAIHTISISALTMDEDSILVGYGPEKMIVNKGKLFVANSGGYGTDSTVSVIDINTKKVVDTVFVKHCPKDMVIDANGNIWVYCSGVPNYSNGTFYNSGISKISSTDYSVKSFDLSNPSYAVKSIAINNAKDQVYFITDAVYCMDIDATSLPINSLIDDSFYGIDVDPLTDNIWACDVKSYSAPSDVVVYSNTGQELKRYTVGVIPNSCIFNR